jgi:AraC-like DNA-binding protein
MIRDLCMELSNDYMTLKLSRLRGAEEMELKGRGLLFLILKCGAGACHCGPTPRRMGSGDVLVVDSACGGKIQPRDNGEMVFWFFTAEFEHLFPLFSGREICLLQNVAGGFKTGRVYPASTPLAKECLRLAEEVPVQFNLDHRSHVLRIVSAILTAEFKAMQPKLSDFVPMRDHVLQVFERLQTNELLSLSVGELAKKFNCNRRHLNRLFHQHFGVSVAALRMEMRLLKAVSLLVDPDAKIIYVAEKCGFNHLGLFNTCFKKRFGATPSQWRKIVTQTSNRPAETGAAGPAMQAQGLRLALEESDAGRTGSGQTRPLERVALSQLLKDVVAVKNGMRPQSFERKEPGAFGVTAEGRGDRRARVGA